MGSSIFFYIIGLVVIVVYVVLLPALQGVAKIKRTSKSQTKEKDFNDEEPEAISSSTYSGYVPPSDAFLDSKLTKKSRQIKLQNIEKKDLPISYVPDFEKEQKRGGDVHKPTKFEEIEEVKNPDNYDYDLDELIREENEKDEKEKLKEHENRFTSADRENV